MTGTRLHISLDTELSTFERATYNIVLRPSVLASLATEAGPTGTVDSGWPENYSYNFHSHPKHRNSQLVEFTS